MFIVPERRARCMGAVLALLGCSSAVANGPNMALLPVGSTGPHSITGNTIEVVAGSTVTLEFYVSDWGLFGNLYVAMATVDPSGYLGANAVPSIPGVDLIPLGYAPPDPDGGSRGQGLFIEQLACTLSGDACASVGPCPPGDGFCTENSRWACAGFAPLGVTEYTSLATYSVGCLCQSPGGGPLDPGDINQGYLGTIRLVIPAEAAGGYTVGLNTSDNFTYVSTGQLLNPNIRVFTPTHIVVRADTSVGACCASGGGCSIEAEGDCLAGGGVYLGNSLSNPFNCDGPDGDDDGVRNECDGCPQDAGKIAPGVCGCGLPDMGDADGDGVLDCVDACPGVDDTMVGSDCTGDIPAVSTWGLVVLALLLMTGGTLNRHPSHASGQ